MAAIDQPVHPEKPAQRIDRSGLAARADTLYTDAKGEEKYSVRKRAESVLERMGEFLRRVMEPDEAIFYIARAQVMPGVLEQLFMGWLGTISMPGALLVFTNKRIIALRVRNKGFQDWQWDRGVRVARWGDIVSLKVKGLFSRVLTLKLRSGQKMSYWRVTTTDAKKIALLVNVLQPGSSGETSSAGAMNSLCPSCLSTLAEKHYLCPNCQLQFKNEKSLMWRGLLIPGGACFYVGMVSLGVLRLIGETIFLLVTLGLLVDALNSPSAESSSDAIGGLIALVLLLVFEKAIGIVHSRRIVRDFLPVN
jgi:hypothetical protein